jgi:hypothetical protein
MGSHYWKKSLDRKNALENNVFNNVFKHFFQNIYIRIMFSIFYSNSFFRTYLCEEYFQYFIQTFFLMSSIKDND